MYFDMNDKYATKFLNSYCARHCPTHHSPHGKLHCECGETGCYDWQWQPPPPDDSTICVTSNNTEVVFFPMYSTGTALVRGGGGDTPFQKNRHYYWEIKMLTHLYGTDVMVGIGTSKINRSDLRNRFCSALGINGESWGYSYNGFIQHDLIVREYATQFGFGSLIGVHLDMCVGQLEYYLNRKPLGIAFKGLKSRQLYPMASSTAANSAMKITCSISLENTLQMKCLQVIAKHPTIYKQYKNIPGLDRIFKKQYFWLLPNDDDNIMPNSSSKRKLGSGTGVVMERRAILKVK